MKTTLLPASLVSFLLAIAPIATAQQMNYQGRLTDSSGAPRPGPQATLSFSIHSAPTAGTLVWGPFQINADLIDGRFSVKLGDSDGKDVNNRTLTAALSNPAGLRYLELKVGTDAPLPRQQILAAPTALYAAHATTADTAANFTSLVLKTDEINRRVGIGTATPEFPLSFSNAPLGDKISLWSNVNGVFGFGVHGDGLLQIYTPVSLNDIVFGYGRSASMTETMRIKGNGNVGIGTTVPLAQLHLKGSGVPASIVESSAATGAASDLWSTAPNGMSWRISSLPGAGVGSPGLLSFSAGPSPTVNPTSSPLFLRSDGRVGIGTFAPIAPLHVMGEAFPTYLLAAVVEAGGVGPYPLPYAERNKATDPPATLRAFSIVSDKGVLAQNFDVKSDERIKTIVATSDSSADLATMLAIRITDYTFKDAIGSGSAPEKKLIAQQLETVFPQAVSRSTNSVPDIYKRAMIEDGWVKLATDLKPGERVRLIGLKGEGTHVVLEVAGDGFRADFTPDGAEVFVFGREVNDFRTVDYDAVAMLNVSATQQIKKEKDAEVEALRGENAGLRARIALLEAGDQLLEAKIAAIEKLLDVPNLPFDQSISIKINGGSH